MIRVGARLHVGKLCMIAVLCGWSAACSSFAPSIAPQANAADSIQLVKETQLTDEGWEVGPWSPDGSRLVVLKRELGTEPHDAPIVVVNLRDGSRAEVVQKGMGVVWSSDGTALAIESVSENQQQDLWLYLLEKHQATQLDGIAGTPLLWLADGRLVYEADDGLWSAKLDLSNAHAEVSSRAVSEQTQLLKYERAHGRRWSLPSPQLQSIMLYDGTNDQDRKWWLVQPDGEQLRVDKRLYSIGTCCAWSNDGRMLAFFVSEPWLGSEVIPNSGLGLYVVDADGKNLRRVLASQDIGAGAFISMSFAPDGQTLAFEWSKSGEGFPFNNTQIYLVNLDGSGLRNRTPNSAPHRWLRWSPNGKYIAYQKKDGTIWIAEVTGGK